MALEILPFLAFLLVFYLFPLLRLIKFSFFDPGFTLKHYVHVYKVPCYLRVLWTTLKISLIVTASCLVLGYPLAYFLVHLRERTRNILFIFVIMPFFTSFLVRTYAWMALLGRNGVINNLLRAMGVITVPLKLMHNMFGVNVGMTHVLLPFMILPLYSVMKGIDRNLIKAAQNLGATPYQSFWKVFFPLSLPGMGAGIILVFILSIGFYITPSLLGGLKETMLSQLIYNTVNDLLNWGFASVLALILIVTVLIILGIFNRFLSLDKIWGS
ncbi:MAG: ABC transporter permease [Deltaproteobacteria bacterium]|nr:ABC transporter permease [Deltaproteobacteria bacterium]